MRRNPAPGIRKDAYYEEIADLLRTMPSDWRRQYRSGKDKLSAIGGPVLPAGTSAASAPTPEQAMLLIGITAGGNPSGDTPFGPHKVPKAVREAAMKGIRLSHANNYGAWDFIGLARAIELVIVPSVSDTTFKRMGKYLFRHKKDARASGFGDDENPSRGYLAWLNWGGDPAVTWTRAFERNPADGGGEALTAAALTVPKAKKTLPAKAIAVDVSDGYAYPGRGNIALLLLHPRVRTRGEIRPTDILGFGNAGSTYDENFKIGVAAAEPGYGYLLYALLAEIGQKRVRGSVLKGSETQTEYAQRFWARQPGGKITALSPKEFKEQFGVASADVLLKAGEQVVTGGSNALRREDDDLSVRGARTEVLQSLYGMGTNYFGDYYGVSVVASGIGPETIPRPMSPQEGVARLEKATQALRWPDIAIVQYEVRGNKEGYLVRIPKGRSVLGPESILGRFYSHYESQVQIRETDRLREAPNFESIETTFRSGFAGGGKSAAANTVRKAMERGERLKEALAQAGIDAQDKQLDFLRYLREAAYAYEMRRGRRDRPVRVANPRRFPTHLTIFMPV